jgi:hypothetical protein
MNPRQNSMTVAKAAFLVTLAMMIISRLSSLGTPPLSGAEATHALQAYAQVNEGSWIQEGGFDQTPTNPLYHAVTSLLFWFIQDSTFTARLADALSGIGLLLALLLFRDRIKASGLLLLSALCVLSPVLLTVGRTAGGGLPGLLGIVIAIGLLLSESHPPPRNRVRWAAAALGVSLVSGPGTIQGLFGLLIAYGLAHLDPDRQAWLPEINGTIKSLLKELWVTLLVAAVSAAGLGLFPGGLIGISGQFTAWLSGWNSPAAYGIISTLAMLALYEPLVVVFGAMGGFFAWKSHDRVGKAASLWSLGSILALVIYPGRSPDMLIWVVVPLTFLAARSLLRLINLIAGEDLRSELIGLTSILLVMGTVAYMFLLHFSIGLGPGFAVLDPSYSILIAFGVLAIAAIVLVLFGLGWSWKLVLEAAGAAAAIFMLATTVSSAWRLNYSSLVNSAQLLWRPAVNTPAFSYLLESMRVGSLKEHGADDGISFYASERIPPSMAWYLRDFERAESVFEPEKGYVPAILYRSESEPPQTGAGYIGQDFAVRERKGWQTELPANFLAWWFKRDAPVERDHWVLLLRSDLVDLSQGASGDAGSVEQE